MSRSLVCWLLLCALSSTAPLFAQTNSQWELHAIDAAAEYPACAVIDVNKDGKLDLVNGGFWFEAPTWKKHFLREVEVIRGRFDDYSNLPLDVNGDGWTDIVSVNYRSKSLFWLENPGEVIKTKPDTPWEKRLIDTPGPMETGRLADLDGDGDPDIVPNGIGFACWYEFDKGKFIKHDLLAELSSHGIGVGDINGDRRLDLIGTGGWLEAPADPRNGRWIWHAEFNLSRDASIPVLVHDVDGDGDADLIWGRGHQFGLYWLEQTKNDGNRDWERHTIDTEYSQFHSLLLADLDGDKKIELIAGKRYMGHEGKDPGEYDTLGIFSYKFLPKTRSWERTAIHTGGEVGFGVDPKAADVDGDGDIDLVMGDRDGFFLLENRLGKPVEGPPLTPPYPQPTVLDPSYHQRPLQKQLESKIEPVKIAADWAARKAEIRRGMELAMGKLPTPDRRVPLDVKIISEEETPEYTRVLLSYACERGDRTPAYLLIPKAVKANPGKRHPAMLCLHPTNKDGKLQTIGLVGEQTRHYGDQLAKLGFVCLVPDYPSFGDYKEYDFAQKDAGGKEPLYVSGTMKAIWTNVRALDLLETLDYVDAEKVGAIGHSLGGHNALFTAVFEPRIKCVVTSCGFTGFHDYYGGKLAGWTSDRYMPRIRDVYENNPDKMPFDFHEVLAAIAPRPIFVAAPLHDSNFDNPGVRKVIAAAGGVYELYGAKDKLTAIYPDCAHDFPDDVRAQVYDWLKKELK
ncbi:alpha/beta fold hydrolase [Anatilimnocola floriformis]|uniref:alpha/beta fold hydrolase n=1 Tax=Anatilimnocola floriformis TaxID=2948575 RepID=UPI0020C27A94|nr:alpha/beta fold hydrolase [Anatilimnocola floriformis]